MRDLFDWVLARITIRLLKYMFGACEPPYDIECLSCASARMIDALRDVGSHQLMTGRDIKP